MSRGNFPKIKKEIKQFLKNEEGKITKEEIVNLGTTIAAISFFVSGNMSESHNSYVKKQESNIPEEGTLLASSDDSQLLAHDSEYVDDCHDSHSSCSHDSCHSQHSSCHSNHSSCHSNHSSCHDNCHISHDEHYSCDGASHDDSTQHGSGEPHDSCHSNHSSCHTNHSSCHTNHSSCHNSHSSCHNSHSSCHNSHSSCHDSHDSCGCPFIIVWTGNEFVLENNILPQSEDSERDNLIVEDLYKFENKPVPEDGFYKIRIAEFEEEESEFKDFELIRISHPKKVQIGVLGNKIIAYKNIIKPKSFLVENKKVKTEEVIKRKRGDSVSLYFNKISKKHNLLVMQAGLRGGERRIKEADQILKESDRGAIDSFAAKALIASGLLSSGTTYAKYSLVYYIIDNGNQLIADTHPREKISTSLVDLESYLEDKKSSIEIEIKSTDTHVLSPIGIAERVSMKDLEIQRLKPGSITHLKKGKDNLKLKPGESLTVNFSARKTLNDKEETFLLKTKGYYEKI